MSRIASVILGLIVISSSLHAQVPQLINYQGRVLVGTANFNGTGQFRFMLVSTDGGTIYWTNDGTNGPPLTSVSLTVTNGLYSVLLGDTSLTNMTPIPATVFTTHSDVRLRVFFDDGTHGSQYLWPDQRIGSVGYAMLSSNVPDGAITGAKIASATITSSNIANGAVSTAQLGSNAVTSSNIANGAVGTAQLGNNAVTSSNIANGAVSTAQLGSNAVTSSNIASGAVGTTQIANAAVTSAKVGVPLSLSGSVPSGSAIITGNSSSGSGNGAEGDSLNGNGIVGTSHGHGVAGVIGNSDKSDGFAGYFTNTAGGFSLVANGSLSLEGARTFIHGFDGSSGTGNHWFSNGTPANPDGDLMMGLHRNGTNNYDLNVNGKVSAASSTGTGVFGRTGLSGQNIAGVWGQNSANGSLGFLGGIDPQFSQHVGVYGESDQQGVIGHGTTDGATGVFGNSTAVGGFGVRGETNTGVGVQGRSFGANGSGVVGKATNSSSGTGLYGSGATAGVYGDGVPLNAPYGVFGIVNSGEGNGGRTGQGVHGEGNGTYDVGVRGNATGSVGDGVLGTGDYGVLGIGPSVGVAGRCDGSVAHYSFEAGVLGYNSFPGGYAGYFNGDVHVEGTFSKTGGAFKIDHPLDPANKYLLHSFVESPDMMNIYNGNVILDGNGQAVVQLPEWFGALNKEFRYQLTAIGAPGPNLYIAAKVENNQFKIAGGNPGTEVSWQVTGVRQDAWANAHRIPVEQEKADNERGKYMFPELFGQPAEKKIGMLPHAPAAKKQ